jgi:hypothetical protein
MRPAQRRRTLSAVLISAAVHAAIIAVLASYGPRLTFPRESAGPPLAVIPVLILPSAPPPVGGPAGKPTPIRLHQRAQRFAPAEAPIAPLVIPETPAPRAPVAPTAPLITPPAPDPLANNARQALRGLVGCANANALGLTLEERDKCNDKLAAGVRGARDIGLGIEPGKAADFAREGARKEQDYRYMRAPPTPGSAPGAQGAGASAETLGKNLGNDRPAATVPF